MYKLGKGMGALLLVAYFPEKFLFRLLIREDLRDSKGGGSNPGALNSPERRSKIFSPLLFLFTLSSFLFATHLYLPVERTPARPTYTSGFDIFTKRDYFSLKPRGNSPSFDHCTPKTSKSFGNEPMPSIHLRSALISFGMGGSNWQRQRGSR